MYIYAYMIFTYFYTVSFFQKSISLFMLTLPLYLISWEFEGTPPQCHPLQPGTKASLRDYQPSSTNILDEYDLL